MTENFGRAEYVIGRSRKNPVLVYTSKSDRTRVYEFMVASRFKAAGLVSWKCVSCVKIRNDYRNLGEKLNRKVPLILVDGDIIKEDPENPLNAPHFCNGKDAIEAIIDRAKLGFLAKHENQLKDQKKLKETIQLYAKKAVDESPIPLNAKEKKLVERVIDSRCLNLYNSVSRRKRKRNREQIDANDTQDFMENEPTTSAVVDEQSVADQDIEKKSNKSSKSKVEGAVYYYVSETEEKVNVKKVNTKLEPNHRKHEKDVEPKSAREENQKPAKCGDIILADMQDVQYDIELST